MAKQKGMCALCGKECELTYEHIPPKAAFNSKPVKLYSGEKILFDGDRLPWDFQGLKYIDRQKGSGKYSICQECNNNTGAWYGETYKSIAYIIAEALEMSKEEPIQGICIEEVYGVRFIKQILSMFCSVNDYPALVGYLKTSETENKSEHSPLFNTIVSAQNALRNAVFLTEELRAFVRDKNAVGLDKSKFKLCMYETNSTLIKLNAVSTVLNFSDNRFVTVSELIVPPLGFLLYYNPSDNLECIGVDITFLADYGYDEKLKIEFPLQVLEMNTYFPTDYRTKEQIENDSKEAKEWCAKQEEVCDEQ